MLAVKVHLEMRVWKSEQEVSKVKSGMQQEFLPAAHEVHDLEFVPVVEGSRVPVGARDDVTVKFNSDTVSLQSELIDQRGKRRNVFERFLFPIYGEFHRRFKVAEVVASSESSWVFEISGLPGGTEYELARGGAAPVTCLH